MIRRIAASFLAVTLAISVAAFSAQSQDKIGSSYLPSDAMLTAVVSVAETMASPSLEMYPVEIFEALGKENVGIVPSEIERAKLVVGTPGPNGPMVALILFLNRDVTLDDLKEGSIDREDAIKVGGGKCYRVVAAPDTVVHLANPRTLIIATENYMESVLDVGEAGAKDGALAKLADATPHRGNLTLLLAVEPVRPMINGLIQFQAGQIPPAFQDLTKIPNLLDAMMVQLDLEDSAAGFRTVMLARDQDSSDQLLAITKKAIEMGRQIGVAEATKEIQDDDAVSVASRQYVNRMADQITALLTPVQDGRKLTIQTSSNYGIASQGVLIGLLLPAVQAARGAARRLSSSNNMQELGLAFHNYHSTYNRLPGTISSESGEPLLSWRVQILPFMNELDLYSQFHMDEAWDSEHNRGLMSKMPAVYADPRVKLEPGFTIYQRPVGEDTVFSPGETTRFRDILDGLSNTIMIIETNEANAVEWTKPSDIRIDSSDPASLSRDRLGVHATLGDGLVHVLPADLDPETLKKLLTKSGKEIIDFDR